MTEHKMSFIGDIMIVVAITIWMVVEKDQTINPLHWNKAVEFCKENGGIEKVYTDLWDIEVRCTNGAIFYTTKKEIEAAKHG